jgi:hypothetical protein
MITVETILKSVMGKLCCMTNRRVCSKNNATGLVVEHENVSPPEHLGSSLSKCTLRIRVNTIFATFCTQLVWIVFFVQQFIFFRWYLYLLVSNMISMSDDISLVGQELLALTQDTRYPPVL